MRTTVMALAMLLAACTSTETAAVTETVTATLRLELPPGFVATLDKQDEPLAPDEDHALLAGPHTVTVKTPCGSHTAQIEPAAGTRAVLGEDDFAGLSFASLTIRATDLDHNPLQPRITLDGWLVPSSASMVASVPACKARMKVSAPELGAFIEDVELTEGQALVRSIVLTPGSDVVRIHGGPLKFHDWRLFPEATDERGNPLGPGDSWDHTLATFDIDQREVTTAEFHACSVDGGCTSSYLQRRTTRDPPEREIPLCTTDIIDPLRTPRPDKGQVAMNCVVTWEAEEYCRWLRKRLPDVEEWEFAARSRGDDSQWLPDKVCPDSEDDAPCPRKAQKEPSAPCTVRTVETAEGICGMFDNVAELVTPTVRTFPEIRAAGWSYLSWNLPWEQDAGGGVQLGARQSPGVGFRCARSVLPALSERQAPRNP